MNESAIVRAIRGFKTAIAANEADEVRELATRYLDVEQALEANISALSEQVNALYAAGEDPTWSQLYRLERFQRLEAQLVAELARFNGWAAQIITEQQLKLGVQAIDDAAVVLEMSKPGLGLAVNMPHDAVQAMAGIARNGAPLGDLLAKSYAPARTAIVKELVRSVALGRNPKVTAAAIRRATAIPLDSALTIARTEQMRVYNAASLGTYREMGVTQYQRLADYSERTCIACIAASGEILSTEAELSDHPRGRCFVGETLVSGPAPVGATSRKYRGEVVTIRTASGNLATVTPNHPILTDRGWVAAGLLREGDNVVSCTGHEREAASVDPDEYQVPTRIKDVRSARRMNRSVHVPTTAEDFHGDGNAGQCEVNVVRTDSLLGSALHPLLAKTLGEGDFGRRDVQSALLSRQGSLALLGQLLHMGAGHVVHELGELFAPLWGDGFAHQDICLALASDGDACFNQPQTNSTPCDAIGVRQRVLGLSRFVSSHELVDGEFTSVGEAALGRGEPVPLAPAAKEPTSLEFIGQALLGGVKAPSGVLRTLAGSIRLDRVLEVGVRSFSGHVYNLQTKGHWYIAQGIIAHNCTCVPIIPGVTNPEIESSEAWFNRQPEGVQLAIAGRGRFDAYQSGQVKWSELATHTSDPVWGGSLTPTPVSAL